VKIGTALSTSPRENRPWCGIHAHITCWAPNACASLITLPTSFASRVKSTPVEVMRKPAFFTCAANSAGASL
jgi:hypothetical protein